MSVENFGPDYIETPDDAITFGEAQDDVVADTKKNLNDLHDEVDPSLSNTVESYTKSDEQYYFLGQTNVEEGDIRNVTDAIESQEKLSNTNITIIGGADELFMPKEKGQLVLDAEIVKLRALQSSFGGANATVIDALIAELTDSARHEALADKYSRADKRSNLGNARLIAARIASGYVQVLTTIADKIRDTGNDIAVSYTIPWEKCVIGSRGNNLVDRKINVTITMTADTQVVDAPVSSDEEDPTNTTVDPTNTTVDPTNTTVDPTNTTVDPTNTAIDVVDTVPLVIVHSMIADVLNPQGKVVFWDSKYTYDHTARSKLPNGDMVISIKDKTSGQVVLDVGYTPDGIAYLGLDGYRHMFVADATQQSLDDFIDGVAVHVMAADTPKFELLLSKVADGKKAQEMPPVAQDVIPPVVQDVVPSPSIEEPIQQDDGELEIEGSNKFTEAFSLSTVEVNNNQNESGKLLTLLPNTNTDFLSAAANPSLFTIDGNGNYFPNIQAIQKHYDDNGLQIEFVMPGPTYEGGNEITGLAIDRYIDENGKEKISHVGSSTNFSGKASSMGLLLIENGKMSLHHTLDDPVPMIPKDAEAITLSSVKRPDPDKPGEYKILQSNVEKYKYGHWIVEDDKGNVSILILKDMSNADKLALVNDKKYKRILYCDVLGNNAHLDAYWSRNDDVMTYSYHGAADVLWDGTGGASEVRGNMPGLLVVAVPKKQDNVGTVPVTSTKKGNTTIPLEKPILEPVAEEPVVVEEPKVLLDPTIVLLYAGLGDDGLQKLQSNLSALPDTKLLDALRTEDTFEIVLQLLKIQDVSRKKEIMKLLLSIPLQNALSDITSDQLVTGLLSITDRNLQGQVVANLLLGNIYPAMLMIGMKEKSEYSTNNIVDKDRLDNNFIKNLERKNRVFDTWLDILNGNKLLANEFGQRSAMPSDVKDAYLMFVSDGIRDQVKDQFPSQNIPSRKIQSPGNYVIISKTDGHAYLFDADHRLVSRKSVLLGSDKSDYPFAVHDYPVKNDAGQTINFDPPNRTPRGLYAIEARGPKEKIGKYMQFFPKDNQIDYGPFNKNGDRKRTIGIHELYSDEYSKRDLAIRSTNVDDKFLSNGCINMHNDYYAEIWDHIDIGSYVYVS